jgi:two-component system nitrate/nitrite response regulator NarL
VRVFVVDDHPLYREGLTRAIKERPEFELVGEAEDGQQALEGIRQLQPRVAVVDVRMPGLDGVALAAAVRRDRVPTRILLLSAVTDSALVYDAIEAGASGYLSKEAGRDSICNAIARAARGEAVLAESVQTGLARQIRNRRDVRAPVLTSREREVLVRVAAGSSTPEIAKALIVSPATVKTHLQNLYAKLDVSDRAAAVAEAMRQGLLE